MLDLELLGESSWRGPGGKRKPPIYKRTWFRALIALFILGLCGVFGVFVFVISPLREKAETYDMDECKRLESASIIYDRTGAEIGRIFVMNRTPVKLDEVPPHLINALTSQEDSRFFQHDGVDYIGILRALWLTAKVGRVTQGASTLTQQLARNTFELRERSIKRKLLEAFVAQRLEKHYTKNEILEHYLNRIFFGSGGSQQFYGVQAAALGYFGKDVKDLNLEESATIVGLIKAPNLYSPLRHVSASIKARNMVFHRMMEEGHLTPEDEELYSKKPMITAIQNVDSRLTFVYDEVSRQVKKIFGEERSVTGGFKIYTTIDNDMQRAAEASVRKRLAEVETRARYPHQTFQQYHDVLVDWRSKLEAKEIDPATPKPLPQYLQGSALVIDNEDGGVLALVGGRDYKDSQLNRAFASPRPVGTAFLPLVYATAFSTPRFFPGSRLPDTPVNNDMVMLGGFTGILGEWGEEVEKPIWTMDQISARDALVRSRMAAVRMAYQLSGEGEDDRLDLNPFKEIARNAGIESPLIDFPSAIVGASPARMDEMCLAYSCFPNGGSRPSKIHLINRITDTQGKVIYSLPEEDTQPVQAMDDIAAAQVNSCLVDSLEHGTGSAAYRDFGLKKFPAAGKTGTHYNFKDLWFLGYSSSVTCGVWVGFDKPKTIYENAFSSRIALPIWSDIMNASTGSHKPQPFNQPKNATKVEICRTSGLRATDYCVRKLIDNGGRERKVRDTFTELARPGTVFEDICTTHLGEGVALDLLAFQSPIGRFDTGGAAGTTTGVGTIIGVDPIRMRQPTVVGADPYNVVKSTVKPEDRSKESATVKRATAVTDDNDTSDDLPIRLAPPAVAKLDF